MLHMMTLHVMTAYLGPGQQRHGTARKPYCVSMRQAHTECYARIPWPCFHTDQEQSDNDFHFMGGGIGVQGLC